jgi:hypothetical protein
MTGGPTSPARALGRGDTRPAFPAPLWQSWRNRGPLSPLPPSRMVGSFSTTRRNRGHAAPGRAAHGKRNLFEKVPYGVGTRDQAIRASNRGFSFCAVLPGALPDALKRCPTRPRLARPGRELPGRLRERNLLRFRLPGAPFQSPGRKSGLGSDGSLHLCPEGGAIPPFTLPRREQPGKFRPRTAPGRHGNGAKMAGKRNITTRIFTLYPLSFLDSS